MLNLERRNKILELVGERGKVEVAELSRRFKTSEATIRSDLKDLHDRGLLRRAHGGAVRLEAIGADPSLQIKAGIHGDQKRRIGAAAAALVVDGESIILDSGTTTQQVARHLKGKRDVKVITNAINVASELVATNGVQLIPCSADSSGKTRSPSSDTSRRTCSFSSPPTSSFSASTRSISSSA